jgi:hypothetical protein
MTVAIAWLTRAWGAIVAAAKWLWAHPAALAAAAGTLLGALVVLRSKRNQVENLKDAIEVQRIRTSVARDEAKVEVLTQNADEHAGKVAELQIQIADSKRRAAELAHATSLEGRTDDEVAKMFSDAGL